ncbi:MAG: hypothetical protein IMZ52_08670 [Actinobacteria bacterium]|nr:hypothetical protein [Actinomycetota bacterium]MBE3121489.1 hypothetical protein [Thermoplasmata archaeon]
MTDNFDLNLDPIKDFIRNKLKEITNNNVGQYASDIDEIRYIQNKDGQQRLAIIDYHKVNNKSLSIVNINFVVTSGKKASLRCQSELAQKDNISFYLIFYTCELNESMRFKIYDVIFYKGRFFTDFIGEYSLDEYLNFILSLKPMSSDDFKKRYYDVLNKFPENN